MMTYDEAVEHVSITGEILRAKFEASYPGAFESARRVIHQDETVNDSMYAWYGLLRNGITIFNLSPTYSPTAKEELNSDYSYVQRFINDFRTAENWQAFIFEHININK